MSYLVFARKYRPQTFSQVIGQHHVTQTLSNAFVQNRVHHAFLFCGPRGCGKTTTARILGKAINCEKGPTPEPCGTCEACVSIRAGTAVDYFEMDGASNRGIDSIRDLTEAVRYQPAVLRKKVYVIDEVHMLTTEAFNALLKTLEEPPDHVTFVMATTEPHKVPNTILSRCQRFDFKLVSSARLVEHMTDIFAREEIDIDDGALSLVARESGGSVRDALSLCDQIISYVGDEKIEEEKVAEVLGVADRSLVRTLVTALVARDAKTCLLAVDGALVRGVDEVQIARALVRSLRDLAVAQVAPEAAELVEGSAEELQQLAEQAKEIDPTRVRQMFDRMLSVCDDLAKTEQPRLVLDIGLINAAATEAVIPLGDLLSRLGAMESRLRQGLSTSKVPPKPAPTSSPPASPPEKESPVASPSSSQSPLQAWERVMTGLDQAKEYTLMSVYQTGKVLAWQDGLVKVGFSAGALTSEIAMEKEKVTRMQKFLREHSGEELRFEVSILTSAEEANAVSVLEEVQKRSDQDREDRLEEAKNHGMTKMVLKTFGAAIKEIKIDDV